MKSEMIHWGAQANLAEICDQVIANREAVIIRRRGKEDVALLPAQELSSLLETLHVLRSPRNAERLLDALAQVRRGTSHKE